MRLMHGANNYTPVKLPDYELWAVPVLRDQEKKEEEYRVYVGDKMVRIFNVKTLPDAVKERLAMVNAVVSQKDYDLDETYFHRPWEICKPPHYPDIYITVGWMVGKSKTNNVYYYVVTLSFDELSTIRGETEHDAMAV